MKKILSLIISAITIFSLFIPAFAVNKNNTPIIFVTGFATKDLCVIENGSKRMIFPPEVNVKNLAKDLAPKLAAFALKHDWESFGNVVTTAVNSLLDDVACDKDGNIINGDVDWTYPTKEEILEADSIEFAYDWRKEPMDIADDLQDYIDYVEDVTGSSQVAITCHSMGGTIMLTYISKYGTNELSGIVFNSPAVNGASVCGKALCGDIDVDDDTLAYFIEDISGIELNDLIDTIADILYKSGALNGIGNFANTLIDNIKEQIYKDSLKHIFGTMPGLWSLVPEEDYKNAKEYIFGDDMAEYETFIKKIDKFDSQIRKNRNAILETTASKINFGVISRYNVQSPPLTTDAHRLSDFTIDTEYTSLGATCADIGTTLGNDYKQAVNDGHNHISADGIIDASTCLFPEYTWFIKNMNHDVFSKGMTELENAILFSDKQMTVNDSTQYPQFFEYASDTDIVPLSKDSGTRRLNYSWFELIMKMLSAIISLVKTLVK